MTSKRWIRHAGAKNNLAETAALLTGISSRLGINDHSK